MVHTLHKSLELRWNFVIYNTKIFEHTQKKWYLSMKSMTIIPFISLLEITDYFLQHSYGMTEFTHNLSNSKIQ